MKLTGLSKKFACGHQTGLHSIDMQILYTTQSNSVII